MPDRVLLVHHNTGHHFEMLLALWSNLKSQCEIRISSDSLHHRGRALILEKLGIVQHVVGEQYDGIIVLTSEAAVNESLLGPLRPDTPTIRVVHRADPLNRPDLISLGPFRNPHIIPCSLGLSPALQLTSPLLRKRQGFITQGNIEKRRNYEQLVQIAKTTPSVAFAIVGVAVKGYDTGFLSGIDNVRMYKNLDEIAFYRTCASCRYILPMIDPDRFPNYFRNQFTSSVLVGMGLGLLYVAHQRLFEMYPICGVPYKNYDELPAAINYAAAMPDDEYSALYSQQEERGKLQMSENSKLIFETFERLRK
jgi:hypothetical protein